MRAQLLLLIVMRLILIALVLAGCSKAEPTTQKTEVTVEVPPPKPQKARKVVLAEKILAAIAADDFDQLRPLFRHPGVPVKETDELADLNGDNIARLREKLDDLKIDLAKAKLLRVEGDETGQLPMFDVFLEANGRVYKTHFSVMNSNGNYSLLGVATWIVTAPHP